MNDKQPRTLGLGPDDLDLVCTALDTHAHDALRYHQGEGGEQTAEECAALGSRLRGAVSLDALDDDHDARRVVDLIEAHPGEDDDGDCVIADVGRRGLAGWRPSILRVLRTCVADDRLWAVLCAARERLQRAKGTTP